jgi:hypothetical protein
MRRPTLFSRLTRTWLYPLLPVAAWAALSFYTEGRKAKGAGRMVVIPSVCAWGRGNRAKIRRPLKQSLKTLASSLSLRLCTCCT